MVVTANGRPKARARKPGAPKLLVEQGCFDDGAALVCGVDEVGRGAWAGPVTVGAVVIGPEPKRILRVRDSKELTLEQREHLYPKILGWALAGLADAGCVPDRIILDGNHDYFGRPDQVRTVIDGDARCLSVAAASIVAKVTRDRLMAAEAECYPGYDFDSNRGYPSHRHRCALLGYGPTAIHRRSWIYMDNLPWVQPAPELTLFP